MVALQTSSAPTPVASNANVSQSTAHVTAAPEVKASAEVEVSKTPEVAEVETDPVTGSEIVSKSEDGDTVAVSEEGAEDLQDRRAGSVTEESEESTAEAEITSFAGISNNQMEVFYLEGRISRADYEQEMESREERIQALESQGAQFSTVTTGLDAIMDETQDMGKAIQHATSDVGNDGLRGTERVDVLLEQTLERQSRDETVRGEEQRVWDYQFQA